MLKEVEQPGSDIDKYVDKLALLLEKKKNQILSLKKVLDDFKQHLIEEQTLSTHCSERQTDGDIGQTYEEGEEGFDEMPRMDPGNKENARDIFKPQF